MANNILKDVHQLLCFLFNERVFFIISSKTEKIQATETVEEWVFNTFNETILTFHVNCFKSKIVWFSV